MIERMNVLIVDDQPRARQSLKALLVTWPTVKGVREAASGREAVSSVEESQPDVVLMDVRMPEMDGLEATRLIKARWPKVKIMVLSMYGEYENEARLAGADDFVTKGVLPEQLLTRLAAVAATCSNGMGTI